MEKFEPSIEAMRSCSILGIKHHIPVHSTPSPQWRA